MSAISGIVSSFLGGQAQQSAANTAADAQVNATQIATDAYLRVWEQARQDFAPYLAAGQSGLVSLTQALPQYVNQTLAPIAAQFGNYQLTPLPSASTGMVNPVTGEVTQYSPYTSQNAMSMGFNPTTVSPSMTPNQGNSFGIPGNETNNIPDISRLQYQTNAMNTAPTVQDYGSVPQWFIDLYSQNNPYMGNPNEKAFRENVTAQWNQSFPQTSQPQINQPAPAVQTYPQGAAQTPATGLPTAIPQFYSNAMVPQTNDPAYSGATQSQLEQGGVLSPTVPEFQRSLENFQFKTDDPYYQTRLAQKNEQINAFLAKSGLTGSTAGETYRQRELDDFMAGEYDRQYNRALTERNYLTQTDVDRYNLEAARGDTLYGRQYQSGQDLYNRSLNNALTGDARNQQQILDIYNLMNSLYGTQYGAAIDLANLGSQSTSASAAGGYQTGQAIGQNALQAGNALAQSALTSGQAQANLWNSIGNSGNNALASYNYISSAFNQPQYNTPAYYSGGNAMANPAGGYEGISWNMPY